LRFIPNAVVAEQALPVVEHPNSRKAVARSSEKFGARVLDKVALGWSS